MIDELSVWPTKNLTNKATNQSTLQPNLTWHCNFQSKIADYALHCHRLYLGWAHARGAY